MSASGNPRRIAVVGFDGVQALDLVGPMEVFARANAYRPEAQPAYELLLASPERTDIMSSCGLRFVCGRAVADLPSPLDTVVLTGGTEAGLRAAAVHRELMAWLSHHAVHARRVASVCTGAFLLAAAGLLSGKRATTHWGSCERLQAAWPDVRVDSDAIYVADPPIYTSAGVTAGIDLCLALVEDDCGVATALSVARDLVLFMRRPGDQAQFSSTLKVQTTSSSPLSKLVSAVTDDPTGDLSVSALAARVAMSERNFVRRFRSETGVTPARFVQQVRLERAKTLLTSSSWPLARIAQHSGFGSLDSLHRAFVRHVKVTPAMYRQHFGRRGAEGAR